jgi:tRNA nucleotidyltransferase (CCA-adding enzyme)
MAPRRTLRDTVPPALARARFPAPLLDVLRTLDAAGHRSWVVGGTVRDLLLDRRRDRAVDLDVATPARPAEVTRLFPKVIPTGIEHGTVTVISRGVPVEVTTFRGEGPYLDGRRPSSVSFLDDIDGDLARRDFTVNAIAYDPVGRAVRDPFDGQRDLRRCRLRAVGDAASRFAEDGLRPLRAVRFVAQLGFRIEPATASAIRPALPVVGKVSAERVSQELAKLAVAPHARRALALLDGTGLATVVLPDVATLSPADRRHAFDVASGAPAALPVRLAGLFHALARDQAPIAAARRTREALQRLRFPAQVCEEASRLVLEQGCVLAPRRPPPPTAAAEVRLWLSRVGPERAPALLALWAADAASVRPLARAERERAIVRRLAARSRQVLRGRPPLRTSDLALDGRGAMSLLGIPAGPAVGEALRHLLERVLADPALNTRESLASELRAWWAGRPT